MAKGREHFRKESSIVDAGQDFKYALVSVFRSLLTVPLMWLLLLVYFLLFFLCLQKVGFVLIGTRHSLFFRDLCVVVAYFVI